MKQERFEEMLHMESHGSFEEESLKGIERVLEEMTEEQAKGFLKLMKKSNVDLGKIKFNESGFILNRIVYVERYQFVDLTAFAPLAGSGAEFGNMSMSKTVINMIKQCKRMSDEIQKHKENGEYESMFSYMDKKFLGRELYNIVMDEGSSDEKLSTGFMRGYIRMENGFEIFDDEFMEVFESRIADCPERKKRVRELKRLADEDGILNVYHGSKNDYTDEFSWTVDEEVAKWFGKRFTGNGFVLRGTVHIDDVIDYYTSRGESEVIVPAYLVEITDVVEV